MQLPGRMTAAIAVLEDFETRKVPLKTALNDWARQNRFAGAKDRAFIAGLCLDALRRKRSLSAFMGADSPRAMMLGALGQLWRMPAAEIAEAAEQEPHGPGALTDAECEALRNEGLDNGGATPIGADADIPDWTTPLFERAFDDVGAEGRALAERADIDLRINTLKTTPEKAFSALKNVKAEPSGIIATAARIAAPDASEKAPAVTVIPAFNKGWVEVQDLGSQIAAAAAGDIDGAQVLDYCAGGGGKTLALAALCGNSGQIYAYDADPQRLKPLFHRAKRAGLRNLQIRTPIKRHDRSVLDDMKEKASLVFVDAPCTGSGTWRRHPDTKWRLTEKQLARRMSEQDAVLREAAQYVKPGGRLVYVTCSVFMEENEDRLAAFMEDAPMFRQDDALGHIVASGLLSPTGRTALEQCRTESGGLRLSPNRLGVDGFYIATLTKSDAADN